jgi:hypothetical protein
LKRLLLALAFVLLALPAFALPPINAALDAFTNSDGTTLPTHNANWSNCIIFGASSGTFTIQDNAIAVTAGGDEKDACWATSYNANSEVYLTSTADTLQDFVGVWLRLVNIGSNTTDGYGVEMDFDNDLLRIYRIDNGAGTVLGSTISVVTTHGDSIMAKMVGAQICAWHKTSTGQWSLKGCRDDTTYSAGGQLGISQLNGGTTIGSNDDFGGGNLPTTGWREDRISTAAAQTATTSVATSFGSLPTAGASVFVIFGGFNDGGGALSPTITDNQGVGNTYTISDFEYDGSTTGHGVYIARCPSIGATSGTFTVTVGAWNANSSISAIAISFVGGGTGSPDSTASAQQLTANTTTDTGAGSSTTDNTDLIVQGSNFNGTSTVTEAVANTAPAASGWANYMSTMPSLAYGLQVNLTLTTTTVAPRYTQTLGTSREWFTVLSAYSTTVAATRRPSAPLFLQ